MAERPRAPTAREATWVTVCRYDDLVPELGVAALIESTQVALFRTFDGALYAIDNQDPFSGAFVLSRGIVGSRRGVPTIASPMHKQIFDLRSGICLDDPGKSTAVYAVREHDGFVEVSTG